jgi:hypothetical protein
MIRLEQACPVLFMRTAMHEQAWTSLSMWTAINYDIRKYFYVSHSFIQCRVYCGILHAYKRFWPLGIWPKEPVHRINKIRSIWVKCESNGRRQGPPTPQVWSANQPGTSHNFSVFSPQKWVQTAFRSEQHQSHNSTCGHYISLPKFAFSDITSLTLTLEWTTISFVHNR